LPKGADLQGLALKTPPVEIKQRFFATGEFQVKILDACRIRDLAGNSFPCLPAAGVLDLARANQPPVHATEAQLDLRNAVGGVGRLPNRAIVLEPKLLDAQVAAEAGGNARIPRDFAEKNMMQQAAAKVGLSGGFPGALL
jgi:hypothetical protein